ncbi:MAG TPA: polyprenyl synthetase family protein [Patescibacteria group bacterium]|nr:polyprenyl synthetase family protein [Patescibacteria group bacterium]
MVKDTLQKTKDLVWPEIEKYLKDPAYPIQFAIPDSYKDEANLYWKINREYPERKGKYLRPTLVLLTAQAFGIQNKKVVKTAASMQVSEDWILIHDDIEDKSEIRRGKPTLQKMYGDELAINAGDSLHVIMWKMVNDVGITEINEEFYKMILRTTLGQAIEQIWTNSKVNIDDDKYFFVADSKSAYYSIAGPMRLGAILGGANARQMDDITEFGLHLGRCFQLVDDLLDLEQDKKEGKTTLANTKGVEYTKTLAGKERNTAREIFDTKLGFLSNEPARSELKELIDFILERDS